MNNKLTPSERKHIGRVKELPCSVCEASAPSEAHHIKQGLQYCTVALCAVCHRDNIMGWHGEKRAWKIRKMVELDALNVTNKRLEVK